VIAGGEILCGWLLLYHPDKAGPFGRRQFRHGGIECIGPAGEVNDDEILGEQLQGIREAHCSQILPGDLQIGVCVFLESEYESSLRACGVAALLQVYSIGGWDSRRL
jgi:hypothetical protein